MSAPTTKELYLFKNEIYNKIRELEKNFSIELKNKNLEINTNLSTFNEKVTSILESNKLMIESITNQNYNFEKIEKLETSKNSMNEMLITHKLKIANILSEINKMKLRYDRMVSENIIIPGYIGPGCNYKNLGDFISNSINEMRKLKEDNNYMKKENREIKGKVDLLMRNMNSMLEYNSNKIKELLNIKNNEIEDIFNSKIKKYENNFNSQIKIEEKIKEIGIEIEKINDSKTDIKAVINNKFNEINKKEEEMSEKLFSALKEVEEIQKMKEELNDKIKNIYSKIDNITKNKHIRQPNKLKTGILKNNFGNKLDINNNDNSNNNTNNTNKIKSTGTMPKKNNLNLNSVNNALSPKNIFNNKPSDKKTILSKKHDSKKELNSNLLINKKIVLKENNFINTSKNVKIRDIVKSFDKEIETIEEKDNKLIKSGKNIREKIFGQTITNYNNDNKIILKILNKQNIINENKIKKEKKLKLNNYTKTYKILDNILPISDDEDLKRTKTYQSAKNKKFFKEENNIGLRNVHIVDCNLINLNLLEIPNINDNNNSNDFSNNDKLYNPFLKIRKIKSVDSKRQPKIKNGY